MDAGYQAMIRAIRSDQVPNLLVLQYTKQWLVDNLIVIPSFFFSESAIEKRAPLSDRARRAGWVGCNILLSQIPQDGKIEIVSDGVAVPLEQVRAEFARLRTLATLPTPARGWTLDVLNVIRKLGKAQFSLSEIYGFESHLKALHLQNQNIRPKIRQQLQVLRDMGILRFTSPGKYIIVG